MSKLTVIFVQIDAAKLRIKIGLWKCNFVEKKREIFLHTSSILTNSPPLKTMAIL